MIDREQLRRHLEFFRELGVEGVSRDARWRVRDPSGQVGDPAERVRDPSGQVGGPADPGREPAARVGEPAGHGRVPAGQVGDPAAGVPDPAVRAGGPGARVGGSAARRPGPAPLAAGGDPAAAAPGGTAGPPPAGPAPRPETLEEIRSDLGACTRCKLHAGRTKLVFGVGSPTADLVFVGEAPGQDEDRQGIPFVGRAGQLLTRIIAAIGLSRDEVYIANVIKCRPPRNRNPEPDEVATCEPFLFRQLDVIRPRVVVALGGFAIRTLLQTDEAVSRLRGRVFDYRGAKLVPTFHPAYLLRSPERKRDVWEDMKRVRALLADPGSAP